MSLVQLLLVAVKRLLGQPHVAAPIAPPVEETWEDEVDRLVHAAVADRLASGQIAPECRGAARRFVAPVAATEVHT